MKRSYSIALLAVVMTSVLGGATSLAAAPSNSVRLNADSDAILAVPPLTKGTPAPGKRFSVTPPDYTGTKIFHTVYLPEDWNPDWRTVNERIPVIFEYTGNYWPPSGSSGRAEDASLGFGLSGGKYIWVSLPYVSKDHTHNEIKWWGDTAATVEYAKLNVPRVIETYGGDTNAVFLCGFSRGAIAVNYIGLHDNEIAQLWSAFITHDHFDGARAWGGTDWGAPLETYRTAASNRLMRIAGRPYMVGSGGSGEAAKAFIDSVAPVQTNFFFHHIRMKEIFPEIPNERVIHSHNDRWMLVPSIYRQKAWQWMNRAAEH